MNVCLFTGEGPAFEPLRKAIQEVFSSRVTQLAADGPGGWTSVISRSTLVLLDITSANVFAFYLLGVADALDKRAILLTPFPQPLPPPLEKRLTIIHGWNFDHLKAELQKLSNPAATTTSPPANETPTQKFHRLFGDLLADHDYKHLGPVELEKNTFILRDQEMELPLVQQISHRAKSLNLRVRLL